MINFYGLLEALHRREFISFNPNPEKHIVVQGRFTPDELRQIADVVDQIMKEQESNEG